MEIFCEYFFFLFSTENSICIVYINHLFFSQFDIREKHTCRKDDEIHLISLSHYISSLAEAKCIAVNGRRSEQLAVGANDVFARIYDRRMLTLQKVKL